jgi:transcriptional regulator with XRE-family HTH domain
MSDYISTLGTLECIEKIFHNQYYACLKTLKDDMENMKTKVTENLLKQIANDYNIPEKELFKKYLKKKPKIKKTKDIEDSEESIIQNIIKNDNYEDLIEKNELIEDKKEISEKKPLYMKINKEILPEYLNNNDYYINTETKLIIEKDSKEIVGEQDGKKISFYKSYILKKQSNNMIEKNN